MQIRPLTKATEIDGKLHQEKIKALLSQPEKNTFSIILQHCSRDCEGPVILDKIFLLTVAFIIRQIKKKPYCAEFESRPKRPSRGDIDFQILLRT